MTTVASDVPDVLIATALAEVGSVDGVPVGKKLTRAQLTDTRRGLQAFEEMIGRNAHCLVVAGGLGFRDPDRKKSTEEDLRECLLEHFSYPPERPSGTAHLILDSAGGSLDSAFKTVLFLRRYVKTIRAYVPRSAKSAATLIALGADEVVMSPFAELGPLDTQIRDPRNPTKNVSALDCYQSVDYVQKFGLETLPKTLKVLLKETEARIPLSDLVAIATDFAAKEVVPMLDQVNTVDFGGWGRTLKIGERYARALQLRQGHEDYEDKARQIAESLVYGYTHHPYVIDEVEARRIGLKVSQMSQREYEATLTVTTAPAGCRCVGFAADMTRMADKLPATETQPQDEQGSADGAREHENGKVPENGHQGARSQKRMAQGAHQYR